MYVPFHSSWKYHFTLGRYHYCFSHLYAVDYRHIMYWGTTELSAIQHKPVIAHIQDTSMCSHEVQPYHHRCFHRSHDHLVLNRKLRITNLNTKSRCTKGFQWSTICQLDLTSVTQQGTLPALCDTFKHLRMNNTNSGTWIHQCHNSDSVYL